MLRGLYFEYKCLGAMSSHQEDVPDWSSLFYARDQEKPLAETDRVLRQVDNFRERIIPPYGLEVDEVRVQVKGEKLLEDHKIILEGEADLISPVSFTAQNKEYVFDDCIIDLKLTGDLGNDFGEFSWAKAQDMDHIQAYIYGAIWELPFMYFVFDYKKNPEFLPILKTMKGVEAMEYMQTVLNAKEKILEYEEKKWPAVSSYKLCKNCMLQDVCDKFINKPDAVII
jgi:CRISPR/Cas system-associated exonuclease Cas4 (RecB family)